VPQVLINVKVSDKAAVASAPQVLAAVADAERHLGEDGRILLRPSGTEELVRVMVEATEPGLADKLASEIAAIVGSV
jgi:phosphoglucosamine mutase